jgi:hypothetical protein
MSVNKQIEKILSKPMTRKEFVRHIGLMLLSILGVNAMISRLIHPERHLPGAGPGPEDGRRWGNGKFGA